MAVVTAPGGAVGADDKLSPWRAIPSASILPALARRPWMSATRRGRQDRAAWFRSWLPVRCGDRRFLFRAGAQGAWAVDWMVGAARAGQGDARCVGSDLALRWGQARSQRQRRGAGAGPTATDGA
jgi:hypothetical protein